MVVTCRATRNLFEAAEAAGIPRERLLLGLGLDLKALENPSNSVSWTTMTQIFARLSELVDHDAARLRDIGSHILTVPSYDFLPKLARNMVSLQRLCDFGTRWLAPAMFPHIPLTTEFLSERRVRYHSEIPARYEGSSAFFSVVEGTIRDLPRLLDLPSAVIEQSTVTPRSWEATFLMPPSGSIFERAKRSLHQAFHAHETIELLGRQKIELERSFEALHRASEEFHALLERLPDLVVIHRDGTILWVNRAIVSALGQRAEELIGKPLSLIVHDSSQAALSERMRLPPDAAGLPDLTEFRLRKPDGQVLTIEVAPTQHVTFGGAPARLVLGRDVTDRVRIQQQLVTADRLASLGLLAAGVAHEINNPLAYVLGNIETMGRTLPKVARELTALEGEVDSGRVKEHVGAAIQMLEKAEAMQKTAVEGCLQMRLIVADLKTFSRADEDAVGLVDVRWSLDAATNIARNEIEKRARLITRYGDVPLVRANESRLGQVFLNLLVNAAQAIPDGDPSGNEVRIATRVDALGRVVIEISDTGPGIAAHEMERVFDPFFTTKPVGVGTGLGLSICHGIVAGLGGSIEIASAPGQGATFRVTLPAHPV